MGHVDLPALLWLLFAMGSVASVGGVGCTCAEQNWCSPLATPPPAHEIYAFAVAGGGAEMPAETTTQQWPAFNWDLVTTVAWSIGANETVCFAHERGVRVGKPIKQSQQHILFPRGFSSTPHFPGGRQTACVFKLSRPLAHLRSTAVRPQARFPRIWLSC